MNRDQKAAVVEELTEQIRSAEAIFAVDYRGISVADAADLRGRLRDAQTRFRIVKNSLTERATDQAGAESLKPMLEGPTALAFVSGDAALAAKALSDAARAFGTLEFKGGVMNGSALSADQVRSIARLPARDVLHGQLVGTIAAPLSGLVRTLNALIAGLAIQLQQVAEQGLVGGEAPAEASETAAASARAADADGEAPTAADADGEAGTAADAAPSEAQAEEAAAAQAPAEVSEEAAPDAEVAAPGAEAAPQAAGAAPEPESSEEPETEASDAEASEE
jgi:large subunit ribosomal protein L10